MWYKYKLYRWCVLMMIIRAKFKKVNDLIYISHLDLMRLFQRALRRAGIPVKYSEGFNPHPKLSFATALTLGVSSDGEYMDVELDSYVEIQEFIERLNNVLPEGIRVLNAEYVQDKNSIMSLIRWSSYVIEIPLTEEISKENVEAKISKLLNMDEILMIKEKRKGKKITIKQEDIRDKIRDLFVLVHDNNRIVLKTTLMTGSVGNLKPELLVEALIKYTDIKAIKEDVNIHRLELYIEKDNQITTPI